MKQHILKLGVIVAFYYSMCQIILEIFRALPRPQCKGGVAQLDIFQGRASLELVRITRGCPSCHLRRY